MYLTYHYKNLLVSQGSFGENQMKDRFDDQSRVVFLCVQLGFLHCGTSEFPCPKSSGLRRFETFFQQRASCLDISSQIFGEDVKNPQHNIPVVKFYWKIIRCHKSIFPRDLTLRISTVAHFSVYFSCSSFTTCSYYFV